MIKRKVKQFHFVFVNLLSKRVHKKMSSSEKKPEEFAEIDEKVKAVFDKKGYQLQCKVGSGAFGQVYRAVNVKRDNLLCAVKVMDMTKMSSKLRDKFLPREIAALMEVKHPNAVRVYDIFKMSKKVLQFFRIVKKGLFLFSFSFFLFSFHWSSYLWSTARMAT